MPKPHHVIFCIPEWFTFFHYVFLLIFIVWFIFRLPSLRFVFFYVKWKKKWIFMSWPRVLNLFTIIFGHQLQTIILLCKLSNGWHQCVKPSHFTHSQNLLRIHPFSVSLSSFLLLSLFLKISISLSLTLSLTLTRNLLHIIFALIYQFSGLWPWFTMFDMHDNTDMIRLLSLKMWKFNI